ncbi:MAG: hypothetical protein ABW352_03715 [Polyangiales bacterium]
MNAALLISAAVLSSSAFAQGTPVSRQKNVELNNVIENQGNYDSPPVALPTVFSQPGYDECLVALGQTYCRASAGPWSSVAN